jgi:hypothetical protein
MRLEINMFESVLSSHISRYPEMKIQDVYKLIYQAAMGSEHAISNLGEARAWLERELNELGEGGQEPIKDLISVDGNILRVHLRSYIAANGNLETLLKAFVRTAKEFQGDTHRLEQYRGIALQLAKENELPFHASELESYFDALKTQGYPAVHHSLEYKKKYSPAYRVVKADFLP